jgi:hypothetical protein
MTRPNTAFALQERDDAPTPELAFEPAPPPVLSPGVELLIGQIGQALDAGQGALTVLRQARADRDIEAIRSAASSLAAALVSDPKALARKVALMVKAHE